MALEAAGVDIVVAQGVEAGGHRSVFLSGTYGAYPGLGQHTGPGAGEDPDGGHGHGGGGGGVGTLALVQQVVRHCKVWVPPAQ